MRAARLGRIAARVASLMVAGTLVATADGFARSADAQPRFELGFGATAASSDGPKKSGAAVSAAVMWSFGEHLEFGPMLFADDLGTKLGRLRDPNDQTDLGAVAETHRYAFGGAWRADVPLGRVSGWSPRLGATWGYYRVQDDHVGVIDDAISALGWSLSGGVSRALWATTAIGASARYHQLFDTRQDHYLSATVDIMWRPSGDSRPPAKTTSRNEN